MLIADATPELPPNASSWLMWLITFLIPAGLALYYKWRQLKSEQAKKESDQAREDRATELEEERKEAAQAKADKAAELEMERASAAYAIAQYKEQYDRCKQECQECRDRSKAEAAEFRELGTEMDAAIHSLMESHKKEINEKDQIILALTERAAAAEARLEAKKPRAM